MNFPGCIFFKIYVLICICGSILSSTHLPTEVRFCSVYWNQTSFSSNWRVNNRMIFCHAMNFFTQRTHCTSRTKSTKNKNHTSPKTSFRNESAGKLLDVSRGLDPFFGGEMDVSKTNGKTPQIIHFNRVFHYKPSILGYPYFWKHPNFLRCDFSMFFQFSCIQVGKIKG